MFGFLKNVFTSDDRPLQLETPHEFGESVDGVATIRQMKNGKFRLLVNTNEVIGTYARRRDAVRGATRKGLVINDS